MRPREPALLERLKEITDMVKGEFGIPVVANGDCWGVKDRDRICEMTGETVYILLYNPVERLMIPSSSFFAGVTSIMIARGAEANPSCFSSGGLEDPLTVILPLYTRLAILLDNPMGNTKYCMNTFDLTQSPYNAQTIPGLKQKRHAFKQGLFKVKEYKELCELMELNWEECKKVKRIQEILPGLEKRVRWEDKEVDREVEVELKRKMPVKVDEGAEGKAVEEQSDSPFSQSSTNQNVPILAA